MATRKDLGLIELWRSYGERPTIEKWTSRISLIAGMCVTLAALLLTGRALFDGFLWLWKAL